MQSVLDAPKLMAAADQVGFQEVEKDCKGPV